MWVSHLCNSPSSFLSGRAAILWLVFNRCHFLGYPSEKISVRLGERRQDRPKTDCYQHHSDWLNVSEIWREKVSGKNVWKWWERNQFCKKRIKNSVVKNLWKYLTKFVPTLQLIQIHDFKSKGLSEVSIVRLIRTQHTDSVHRRYGPLHSVRPFACFLIQKKTTRRPYLKIFFVKCQKPTQSSSRRTKWVELNFHFRWCTFDINQFKVK